MARVLTADVERLRLQLGPREIQGAVTDDEEMARRLYVRAIFALIEALVEQHKRLLLHLANRHAITLQPGVHEALSERVHAVKDNGAVTEREQYLQLLRKLRAVYRAAGEGFGEALAVEFGDQGWPAFQAAIIVRDRLTHPKTFEDCQVNEEDLKTVDAGEAWYRGLNKQFVRVARAHRILHKW
ncbi:MAG: hypothetical protein ACRD2N_00360 [Vicinamibacterales bacterium]